MALIIMEWLFPPNGKSPSIRAPLLKSAVTATITKKNTILRFIGITNFNKLYSVTLWIFCQRLTLIGITPQPPSCNEPYVPHGALESIQHLQTDNLHLNCLD